LLASRAKQHRASLARFVLVAHAILIATIYFGPLQAAQRAIALVLKLYTAGFQTVRLALLPCVRVQGAAHVLDRTLHLATSMPQGKYVLPAGSSISFGGCSWKLFYHLGVASALQQRVSFSHPALFCGASCGTLVAAALALQIPMAKVKAFGMELHAGADGRMLGPVGDMSRIVREGLEAMLPEDAHELLNQLIDRGGGLVVSVSVWELGFKNVMDRRARFEHREQLINLLLCSCYIPFYYENVPWYDAGNSKAMTVVGFDGGATDNMPVIDQHTITVSPVKASAVISPSIREFPDHLSIMPGSARDCEELFEQGYHDGCAFVAQQESKVQSVT